MQMLLTGEPIDAATALEWGLVNQVVDPEELDAAVKNLAGKIMRHSGEVIAIGKAAFYGQVSEPDDDAYLAAMPAMSRNAGHQDAQEGMRAFLDKRRPAWPSQR
jgi:enoyl-CoA hydratase/carnithine racemase